MQAILVDLDGTLIDTAPDLARILNEVLEAEGYPPLSLAAARPLIAAGSLRPLIRQGVEQAGELAAEEDFARMETRFLALYRDEPVRDSKIYAPAREVLTGLRSDGTQLGLCTNKRHDLALRVLDALSLTPLFAAITGGGIAGRKPSPEPLLHTLRAMQARPERAVMIGDSAADIEAARAAGMASIAVDFGYSLAPAESLGADKVIGNWRELADALAGL